MTRSRRTGPKPAECPQCGEMAVLPITYGYPDAELMDDAAEGSVILGGCIIREDQVRRACTNCDWSDETFSPDFDDL